MIQLKEILEMLENCNCEKIPSVYRLLIYSEILNQQNYILDLFTLI